MDKSVDLPEPRTTTDVVFDRLYEQILTLELLPGTRISEAEVASRLGVSRQPVRDAFNRLGNLELLVIRPQRATEVRGFSMERIANARFVRLAIELEVITRACAIWTPEFSAILEADIEGQRQAIAARDMNRFHACDYDFHRHICECAGLPHAFETIERCKRLVERLCSLSFDRKYEAKSVTADHEKIAQALADRSVERARAVITSHLARLDETIRELRITHAKYFEDR